MLCIEILLTKIAVMKLIFSFLLIVLCMSNTVCGQDFEPGVQAKGYMDEENTSVDLSTGLFHYKVPLFVLSEGGFNLPVSLNYVGKAVTKDDFPGQVGFNWSLQAGGVVTRIVRGGIADDASNGSVNGKASNVKEASLRERDGESDIFTVNFNGRSLNFFLSSYYKVAQLEKSNVEISCLHNSGGITGWKVIDENGVQYIYQEIEEFESRSHESSVSFNNVVDKSYISSWFITRIIVPNADTIKFQYGVRELSPPYDIQPNMEDRAKTEYSSQLYLYGRPMNEYMFNDTYMPQYKEAINSALNYMEREHVVMRDELNQENSRYANSYYKWDNNISLIMQERIQYHQRVMGLLTGITDIAGVSVEFVRFLDELIDYSNQVGGRMSASELKRAKSILKQMCTRAKPITEKLVTMTSLYRIKTPILKRIVTRDKDVELNYQSEVSQTASNHILQELVLRDAGNNVLQRVNLTRSREGCLKEVKLDLTGGGSHVLSFSYYLENTLPRGVDLWGQWSNLPDKTLKDMTRSDVDEKYIKRFSLSEIRFSTGMTIGVDYGLNMEKINPVTNVPAGGIRVSYVTINRGNGDIEHIVYEYPNTVKWVFNCVSNRDTVYYDEGLGGSFSDVVIKSRIALKGNACVNTGNNGVYYDRVSVSRTGKGREVYSLYVPSPGNVNIRQAFPHGLCGLILGKASYDKNDNLVELVRNKYESGYAPFCINSGFSSWFVADSKVGTYKKYVQVKPFEYCLDQAKLETEYRKQSPVVTYVDKEGSSVLMPYENIYKENIEPRVNVIVPEDNFYYLYYGGKTVLAEQVVYRFADGVNNKYSVDQVQGTLPPGAYVAKYTRYKYDNPEHVMPIRTIEYLSNGDTLVMVTRTASDMMWNADPVVKLMCQQHVIAPVMKRQQFLKPKGEGKYYLLAEEINCFKDTVAPSGNPVFLPDRVYQYLKEECDSLVPGSEALDKTLFSRSRNHYREENKYNYLYTGGRFLPVESVTSSMTSVVCHDQGRGNIIMRAEGTRRSRVDVIDALRRPVSSGTSTIKDGVLGKNLPTSLIVKPEQSAGQYRVYMLVKNSLAALQFNYMITRGSTVTNESSDLIRVRPGEWTLVTFDIHLPAGVNKLEVPLPSGNVALATLTPVGIVFEAMSYDLEGKLFCKLNQGGQLERYEYGSFKKVKRAWDEKGNVLYESYSNF